MYIEQENNIKHSDGYQKSKCSSKLVAQITTKIANVDNYRDRQMRERERQGQITAEFLVYLYILGFLFNRKRTV